MKRTLFVALALSAAFASGVGGDAPSRPAGAKARAARQNGAPKKGPGAEAKPGKPGAPAAAEAQPKVTEVKEAGLKSILAASVARSRPLLVNFWATWCEPCRKEFPDLVKIREKNSTGLLDFVTVSLDDVAELETGVPRFLAQMRAGHVPAYLLNATDADAAINLVDPSWHGELPATFLFDREGRLAYKHMGRVDPAELQAAIDRTLGAKR